MTDEEMENSILATGAVMACIFQQKEVTRCDVVLADGQATNVLEVEFEFLKSPYRVTVEIIPQTEEADDATA